MFSLFKLIEKKIPETMTKFWRFLGINVDYFKVCFVFDGTERKRKPVTTVLESNFFAK